MSNVRTVAQSTNPANRQQREFNLDKAHAVGQFLRVHPDALRIMKRHQHEAKDMFRMLSNLSDACRFNVSRWLVQSGYAK